LLSAGIINVMTNLILRTATQNDLDFLIKIDRDDEGCASPAQYFTQEELSEHRAKIAAFVTHADDCAWVLEDGEAGNLVGAIMCRFRDLMSEATGTYNSLRIVGDTWLHPDTRYCEVFQLWVDPKYRRQGLATRLKQHIESEAQERGVNFVYTHTEEQNAHVIDLNRKLGYHEIRRGPIWDEITRVSLVKRLDRTQPNR
jgi:ribosomal protein S18 acetylase RimI-like enzyme